MIPPALRMPDAPSIDPIASLRHRGYLTFLIGSVISNVGNQMRTITVGWEVFKRTGDQRYLAYIGLTLALPVILLALPSGAAADRYSRRSIIMIAQLGLAASGLGLAWASAWGVSLPWTFLFLLATASFRALGWPASTAIVKGLVPDHVFPNAAMWRSTVFQIAATVGPLLGGVLLAHYSPAVIYLIDAMSSLALVGALLAVHPAPQTRAVEPNSWRSVVDGIRFLNKHPVVWSTMILDMVAVLFGGVTALLPVFADKILNVGETGFGWLRAMPSLGAIVMSLMLAMRPPFRHAGRSLLGAVIVFGVATIVFGVSTSFPLSLASLFVLGAADAISVVIRATVLQLMTPDSMRGRVSAVSAIFIGTSNEMGEVESGYAAHYFGTVRSVVFGGCMTLATVAWVSAQWPALRRLGRLDELAPPEPAEPISE
jgi:MFS family permease